MTIDTVKCPNCGATIQIRSGENRRYVCEYCDSQLILSVYDGTDVLENSAAQTSAKQIPVPKYCTSKIEMPDNDALYTIFSYICEAIDTNACSEDLRRTVMTTMNSIQETVIKERDVREYEKIMGKLQDSFDTDEIMLFYKTAALFGMNKLKTGMFLTNKRVGYLDGKKTFSVRYENLESLLVDIGYTDTIYFYPNANEKIFISALGVDKKEYADMIAFIILKAAESRVNSTAIELILK